MPITPDDQLPGRRTDLAIACFVQLLQNRIVLDGRVVPVLDVFPPTDNIPCVTMTKSGGLGLTQKDVFYNYSADDPSLVVEKVIRKIYDKVITIHIWGHIPEERDYIFTRVEECIEDAVNDDFLFCSKYNLTDLSCSQTGNQCDALTVQNSKTRMRMCPYGGITSTSDPLFRGPSSVLVSAGIHRESVSPRGEVNVDQLDIVPEVYHSTLAVDFKIDVDKVIELDAFLSSEMSEQILG